MINVSNEFKKIMNVRTDFKENAEVSLANGETLTLTEKDFTISNNSVTDAGEASGIPLGVAIGRTVQIELMNDDDRFSEYDFFGAKIRLFLTFQLSETVERIEYGTFTVITPETYGTTVLITAVDNMHKADAEYITELKYPTILRNIVIDACEKMGVILGNATFNNYNFVVSEKPTGITFRQLLGYVAMIAGGNARFDTTGLLKIITYDFEKMENDYNSVINGGRFKPWDNPSNLDGGTFIPWNVGDVVEGGNFSDREDYHILMNWKDLKVDTDDIVITGIKHTYQDLYNNERTAFYGVDGYVLSIENPLIVGKEEEAVELIGSVMVGGRFRQFSGDLVANPLCEFMDPALIVDRRGNVYSSFLTDINFQFFGFTTISNSAKTALRNSAVQYSEATKTLIESKKLINKERTEREAAVEQLANNLKNSSGLFMTEEVQLDGSTIYYMHDKPTLSESMVVWKLTALAFAISNDGGKTYPYGFTVDGTTITRLLYAEGIDADYIDTGALRISDSNGNTLFLADYDTKEVYINASTVKIGSKAITDEFIEQAAAISLNSSNILAEIKRASTAEGNLSTRINANAESISAEVTRAKDEEGKLSTNISVNAGAISAEVKRAQGQEVELAAAISLIDDKVELKASKGQLSSLLSVESDAITIKSNRFSWESTYSSLTSNGKLTAKDVDLSGEITADSGNIGGFTITDHSIYYKNNSLGTIGGIYIGINGISVGNSFIVDEEGNISLGLNTDIEVGGVIKFNNAAWNGVKYGGYTIFTINSSSHAMEVEQDIEIAAGKNIKVTSGDLIMAGSTSYIKSSATGYKIKFESSRTTIMDTYSVLGKSGGQVGFFGSDGAAKKTVSTISSTTAATASTCATKINELINVLKAYNLIG